MFLVNVLPQVLGANCLGQMGCNVYYRASHVVNRVCWWLGLAAHIREFVLGLQKLVRHKLTSLMCHTNTLQGGGRM